jgi:hypothetical protein
LIEICVSHNLNAVCLCESKTAYEGRFPCDLSISFIKDLNRIFTISFKWINLQDEIKVAQLLWIVNCAIPETYLL